jgi:hypothetical protein
VGDGIRAIWFREFTGTGNRQARNVSGGVSFRRPSVRTRTMTSLSPAPCPVAGLIVSGDKPLLDVNGFRVFGILKQRSFVEKHLTD